MVKCSVGTDRVGEHGLYVKVYSKAPATEVVASSADTGAIQYDVVLSSQAEDPL